jgi:hypothetical protein
VFFKHVRITCFFFINAIKFSHVFFIKKTCEKHMLLKKHVILTCQGTHVNHIRGLYKIFYRPLCRKFLSFRVSLSLRFQTMRFENVIFKNIVKRLINFQFNL